VVSDFPRYYRRQDICYQDRRNEKKMHKGTQKVEQKISEDIGIGGFQKIKVRQISGNLMEFP
jgi:hypothetical protein